MLETAWWAYHADSVIHERGHAEASKERHDTRGGLWDQLRAIGVWGHVVGERNAYVATREADVTMIPAMYAAYALCRKSVWHLRSRTRKRAKSLMSWCWEWSAGYRQTRSTIL
jgi:hypothetical protein